jgi:hypothetical protein
MRKQTPGPGRYQYQDEWPEKKKLKIAYPDKQTFLDQLIKREKKDRTPAPGQYDAVKTLKQEEEEKKKASRKGYPLERISYLDEVQYEATLTPGVGSYNPRVMKV